MLRDRLGNGPLGPARADWILILRHAKAETAVRREARLLLPPGSWSLDARFGVLDAWYRRADAIFVGGGGKGRGVHDLLAPLAHGHPPLCFLGRGDPGSVGSTLAARGVVLPLDAPVPSPVAAALESPVLAWSELKAEYDGRAAATAFFQEKGILE
jgi:hypothetical protein